MRLKTKGKYINSQSGIATLGVIVKAEIGASQSAPVPVNKKRAFAPARGVQGASSPRDKSKVLEQIKREARA